MTVCFRHYTLRVRLILKLNFQTLVGATELVLFEQDWYSVILQLHGCLCMSHKCWCFPIKKQGSLCVTHSTSSESSIMEACTTSISSIYASVSYTRNKIHNVGDDITFHYRDLDRIGSHQVIVVSFFIFVLLDLLNLINTIIIIDYTMHICEVF